MGGQDVDGLSPMNYCSPINLQRFPSQKASQFKQRNFGLGREDCGFSPNKIKTPTVNNKSKMEFNYTFKRKGEEIQEGSESDTELKIADSKVMFHNQV